MNLLSLFTDYTLRTIALGAILLGGVSGALGAFALLRRQSLLGDALSHAALPGVVIAFLLTRSKSPAVLLAGAAGAGALAALAIQVIVRRTRLALDSALGLVLSVFFGLGMMLLTLTQRLPDARQAGLSKFLFGQAATMLESDLIFMSIVGGAALLLVALFWKEFKLVAFDADFARSLGFPAQRIELLLTGLTVLGIVVGLQAVGVILMSAMLVAPAAAARQWTDRLASMTVLSAAIGAGSGLVGALISATTPGLSTGPTIVLVVSAVVLVSLLFAPQRGVIAGLIRRARQGREVRAESVLLALNALAHGHADSAHPHSVAAVQAAVFQPASVPVSLRRLAERGLVEPRGADLWALTPAGETAANQLELERRVA